MYTPPLHRMDDRATLVEFMRAHNFATLVTGAAGRLQATHLPLMIDDGEPAVLTAHMARANPQWHDFTDGAEVLAIFAAPHAYISPRHYENPVSVPTWNYVAVHAYGTPRLIEDVTEKHAVVGRLVAQHDADYAARFPAMPADYITKMLGAIVAFEIRVTRIEARYKLSQEKHAVEVSRIVAELDAAPDTAARETADLMRRHGRK